jgi:hypothetical protein
VVSMSRGELPTLTTLINTGAVTALLGDESDPETSSLRTGADYDRPSIRTAFMDDTANPVDTPPVRIKRREPERSIETLLVETYRAAVSLPGYCASRGEGCSAE